MKVPGIERGMVKTALGSIFYLMSDGRMSNKPAILCFHMSPRSSDEFREVLPLLASSGENDIDEGRVVIAFDLPGYGSSDNPKQSCTVDDVADACLQAADSIMGCGNDDKSSSTKYIVLGSLMGDYHCLSLASRYPERIESGILINPWYNPEAKGMEDSTNDDGTPIPDSFVLKDDGSHLIELHSKRSSWLDNDLNLRVVQSELTYLMKRRQRYLKGINIEGGNDYNFKGAAQTIVNRRDKAGQVASQHFLCILGEECMTMFDKFGLEGTKRSNDACTLLKGSDKGDGFVRIESLKGDKSTLNIVNQMPDEVAALCNQFLANI